MTTPETQAFLQKAQESTDAASDLIRRGSFGFAASRAYYSMFTRSGLLDARFHRYLREAFDARQVADYDPIRHISKETAESTVKRAEEFLAATKAFLSQERPQ